MTISLEVKILRANLFFAVIPTDIVQSARTTIQLSSPLACRHSTSRNEHIVNCNQVVRQQRSLREHESCELAGDVSDNGDIVQPGRVLRSCVGKYLLNSRECKFKLQLLLLNKARIFRIICRGIFYIGKLLIQLENFDDLAYFTIPIQSSYNIKRYHL